MTRVSVIELKDVRSLEDGPWDLIVVPRGTVNTVDEEIAAIREVYPDLVVTCREDRYCRDEPEGMSLSWWVHDGTMIEEKKS